MTSKLEPHPLSAIVPQISDEDFGKLAGDISLHGLHHPIVRYQGKILDGNNRYRVCVLLKIAPKFAEFDGDDAAARNYVISANIHRRHLSSDQRREIIAALLKADPTKSNRQVADATNASHHTVGDVRAEMEATGQIAQFLMAKLERQIAGAMEGRKETILPIHQTSTITHKQS